MTQEALAIIGVLAALATLCLFAGAWGRPDPRRARCRACGRDVSSLAFDVRPTCACGADLAEVGVRVPHRARLWPWLVAILCSGSAWLVGHTGVELESAGRLWRDLLPARAYAAVLELTPTAKLSLPDVISIVSKARGDGEPAYTPLEAQTMLDGLLAPGVPRVGTDAERRRLVSELLERARPTGERASNALSYLAVDHVQARASSVGLVVTIRPFLGGDLGSLLLRPRAVTSMGKRYDAQHDDTRLAGEWIAPSIDDAVARGPVLTGRYEVRDTVDIEGDLCWVSNPTVPSPVAPASTPPGLIEVMHTLTGPDPASWPLVTVVGAVRLTVRVEQRSADEEPARTARSSGGFPNPLSLFGRGRSGRKTPNLLSVVDSQPALRSVRETRRIWSTFGDVGPAKALGAAAAGIVTGAVTGAAMVIGSLVPRRRWSLSTPRCTSCRHPIIERPAADSRCSECGQSVAPPRGWLAAARTQSRAARWLKPLVLAGVGIAVSLPVAPRAAAMVERWMKENRDDAADRARTIAVRSIAVSSGATGDDEIAADEEVVAFPTDARLSNDGATWILPVHIWVYEEEASSAARNALIDAFARSLGLDEAAAKDETFRARARLFLVDNERGKRLTAAWSASPPLQALLPTEANGRSETLLSLPAATLKELASAGSVPDGWLSLAVAPRQGQRTHATAAVRMVPPEGVSVVSDIDDTIRVTNVRDRDALLRSTFVAPFAAVEGMAALYRRWQGDGAIFHYVTASPWQLHQPVSTWMQAEGFPRGALRMKAFRWTDETAKDLTAPPEKSKGPHLEALLADYPRRSFILVGDSSASDPELYADLARRHPGSVKAIVIRNTTDEPTDAERWRSTFRDLQSTTWTIFSNPASLPRLDAMVRPSRP